MSLFSYMGHLILYFFIFVSFFQRNEDIGRYYFGLKSLERFLFAFQNKDFKMFPVYSICGFIFESRLSIVSKQ